MNTLIKNKTKIIVHTDNYENELIDSIDEEVLNIFDTIHLMPDTHIGKSVPIGFVAKFDGKIIPNIVGVDIGCGVTTVVIPQTELQIEDITYDKCKQLNDFIKTTIAPVTRNYCIDEEIYKSLNALSFELERIDYHALQLGTLGGGNHFIEINNDQDNIYISVHSGSRYLGQVVNKYHNSFIGFDTDGYVKAKNDVINRLKNANRESEISEVLKNISKTEYQKNYLEGKELDNYLNDVDICIKYAQLSRKYMLQEILQFLNIDLNYEYIDTTHNYIDIKNRIVHKGSISARKGEKVVIPINMRDGMIIGTGKSNSKWLCSAPHGAGRILSRNKAFETLNLADFKTQMEDVITFSVSKNTLDEAPDSYRSIEEIKSVTSQTIDITSVAKVLYNYKSPN